MPKKRLKGHKAKMAAQQKAGKKEGKVKEEAAAVEKTPEDIAAEKLLDRGIIASCAINKSRKLDAGTRDINVQQITIQYQGKILIDNCDFVLNYGQRYGFIDVDGSAGRARSSHPAQPGRVPPEEGDGTDRQDSAAGCARS